MNSLTRFTDLARQGVIALLACGLLISGCTQAMNVNGTTRQHFDPTVIFRPSESEQILSCVQKMRGMKKEEAAELLRKAASKKYDKGDRRQLHYICLTLLQSASYKQFTDGMATLKQYIDASPDSHPDLQGLLYLLERLDQAIISRWSARKTLKKEKQRLQAEIDELMGRLQQANAKIDELSDQLNKLKNIEKIISDREQHDAGSISYE